jgi:hypothetical protein
MLKRIFSTRKGQRRKVTSIGPKDLSRAIEMTNLEILGQPGRPASANPLAMKNDLLEKERDLLLKGQDDFQNLLKKEVILLSDRSVRIARGHSVKAALLTQELTNQIGFQKALM